MAETFTVNAPTSSGAGSSELQGRCKPIRLGLLVDEQFTSLWASKLIKELQDDPAVELAVMIRCAEPQLINSPRRSSLFRLWAALDAWVFREETDPVVQDSKTCNIETITLRRDEANNVKNAAADVARLQAQHLDILVQLAPAEWPDGLSDCTKHGIWTFHYAGYTPGESEAALFWNLYDGKLTSEFVLTSVNGVRRVLHRGVVSNDLISWRRNLGLDHRRRAQSLLRCISKVSRYGWSEVASVDTDNDLPERPRRPSMSGVMPYFLARWCVRAARRLWARIGFREQWFFVYSKDNFPTAGPSPSKTARSDRFTSVRASGYRNCADPFLFERHGKTHLFFEEYEEGQPGVICCAEFGEDGALGKPRQVLSRNYHLSYPFVFEWRDQVYMLPETQDNRSVEIYGAVEFPYRWELAAVLLNNVSAVDSTIFQYKDKLWLFAGGLSGEGTESNELSLFWANSLFGPWQPHPKNPVVCDVRRARPAGSLFFDQGSLIRPGQDCTARYGYAISLNRVDELSETDYREVPLATILPDWMEGIHATHTLNRLGGMTVLDARTRVPRFPLFGRALVRRS
jgi:hypothetical protein